MLQTRRGPFALVLVAALIALAGCAAADAAPRLYAVVEPTTPEPPAPEPAPAPSPTPTTVPADQAPVPPAPEGEGVTFAHMRVPRWGEEYRHPISEGITDHVLDTLGMGHFPTTQLPGEDGNFAVAGHRTDGSRPLASIDTLQVGDEIFVDTALGTYTYAVSGMEIVTPDQVRVVEENPQTGGDDPVGKLLTLVACHPWDSSAYRYIVWAELQAFTAAPA